METYNKVGNTTITHTLNLYKNILEQESDELFKDDSENSVSVDDVFDPFTRKFAFKSTKATRQNTSTCINSAKDGRGEVEVITEIPPYSSDQLLRNATSLQQMRQSGDDSIRLNESCAARLELSDGDKIGIEVAKARAIGELKIDNAVPDKTCMIFGAREALTNVALNGARARLFNIQSDT